MDPVTGRNRRIPLEVLRQNETAQPAERYTATGSAMNSAVFSSSAPAVYSLSTCGALAMYHSETDTNGGSVSFFFLSPSGFNISSSGSTVGYYPPDLISRVNNRYAVFAYVLDGLEWLPQLEAGDSITAVEVLEGFWELDSSTVSGT